MASAAAAAAGEAPGSARTSFTSNLLRVYLMYCQTRTANAAAAAAAAPDEAPAARVPNLLAIYCACT
jgi:hypothetical protein